MLTDNDIKKLSKVFVTKENLETFEDNMNQKFDKLLTAVDGYAKNTEEWKQEMVMLGVEVKRHRKWIEQLAQKQRLQLEP